MEKKYLRQLVSIEFGEGLFRFLIDYSDEVDFVTNLVVLL
jgi:hypothetical protein